MVEALSSEQGFVAIAIPTPCNIQGVCLRRDLTGRLFQYSATRDYLKMFPPPSMNVPKMLSGVLLLKTELVTVSLPAL